MRRRGQASIIGSILFFVLFAAAMAGVAYYSSSQSQANGAANRAQNLNAQKGSEQLTYGALPSGALIIQNTGSSATSLVEVIIKYANGTVYTAAPSTSSLAANNLLQVGQLVPSTAAGSMTLQARYNAILSSTNPADQIGLVTSRGNTFWLKPAVAAATNPNLSYGVTFSASGASVFVSAAVLTVDGVSYTNSQLPVTLTWFTGTKHTYAWQTLPQGTGTRVGATTTGLSTATSGTLTATSPGTVQATYTTQYLLTLTGGSGVTTSPASSTGDGYYSSGTSVQVTVPNAWSAVAGQSRSNLVSYSLDGSSATTVTRSGSGNFVYSITMGAPHAVTFNSNTQYYLTVTGGNGVAYGTASPTGDNWYDSGSSTTVSSNWVWGTVSGQSRTALSNWQLDAANQNPSRSGSGTLTTSSVTMGTYHTVNFVSVTQYYLTLSGGTSTATLGSQTSDGWYDSGTSAQAQSGYVWNTVAGQSRSNLYSWQVDSGAATMVSRAASGTFASGNVAMSTYHTVTFNLVTQYYLTVNGGANLVYLNSQTSDGWYDTGTSIASVTTNTLWSIVAGQSRQNLLSYQVDSGASTSVTRANTGTFSTASITMSTWHTLTFNGQQQYAVNSVGGNSVSCASTPFNDCWGDSGSTATVTTNYVWSVVAGQSRLNLVSWNLDGGANSAATRAGSGFFTTTSVTMNTFHTINFNSATQYYVTTVSSVPASGSVGVLSVSYSYTSSSTTVSQGLSNPGFESGSLSPWGQSYVGGSLVESTTVHSGIYALLMSTGRSCSGACGLVSESQSISISASNTITSSSASIWYYTTDLNINQVGVATNCGGASLMISTPFTPVTGAWTQISTSTGGCSAGTTALSFTVQANSANVFNDNIYVDDAVLSYTYTAPVSGSQSSSPNSFSASGTTVTYTYGVGYNFPSGSTSTSWSATWPSTETYSSNNCLGGAVSGSTLSGTGGACTLTTTRTGTMTLALGASPTGDSWYDSGVSVTLSTSPTGPFSFSSWSASSTNLVIASATSASTTVTPNTYGTVTASYNVNQ